MILWCDGAHDPAENMRRDAALLRWTAVRGAGGPGRRREAVLRLFRFSPPGITLGLSQVPEREIDLERCRSDGVPWASRPTGGRAIFHAEEWTYSLAAPLDDPDWGGTLSETYARASRLVRASLIRLGVPAELAERRSAATASPRPGTAACFAAAARHEIVLGGRKLVGSAQRRTARALLQQGSVLLGPGHLRLPDYLAMPAERRRELRAILEAGAAHAGEYLAPDAPLERWAEALMRELPRGTRRLDAAAGGFLWRAAFC